MNLLLDKGAKINMRDSVWKQTPLHWAVGSEHEAVVAVLLKRGAFIDALGGGRKYSTS